MILFEGLTAVNSTPSTDAHGLKWDRSPSGLFKLRNTAGSGTLSATIRLWGMLRRATNAFGTITCDAKANYSADNDLAMAVISDGVNSLTFDCSYAGAAVSGVKVDVSGATTDGDVAALLVTAINGQRGQAFKVRAVARSGASDHIIDLYNESMNGTAGNVTVTEGCGAGAHAVTGMAGGVDYVWIPVGTNATPSLKGVLNDASAIGSISAGVLVHCEWVYGLQLFDRLYAEVTALSGTSLALESSISRDGVVR